MKNALLYQQLPDEKVKCELCPNFCIIKNGELGVCRVRKNVKGKLYSLNYDKVAAMHTDPIEKKPLYHFLPATPSFSISTMGCNFSCKFCQNHSLSMVEDENQIFGEKISPEELITMALRSGSKSIAYTYTEPTIYFELMLETAKLAKHKGLKNVMVTNGYMSEKAFELIQPYLDGANIDLKAFSDRFYKKYCNAQLFPVLDTIKRMKKRGIWIELTTLLIPNLNSDKKEISELITFILDLDDKIPWHVSRFFPHHNMLETSPTDINLMYEFLETAKERGIQYLYGGNIMAEKWANTYCTECGSLLISRMGYTTTLKNISQGNCTRCGNHTPGIWG